MTIFDKIELLLAVALLLPVLYLSGYLVFRVLGVLRVNAGGWQAGGVGRGGRIWLPALWLFGFFQPLLRAESLLARKWGGKADPGAMRDQGISEVVVELVPMA